MSEQPSENNIDTFLGDAFEHILERYSPVELPQDADLKMTTTEIFDQLQELCPSDRYSPDDVYFLLQSHQFKYYIQGNKLDFVWLMKRKS